MISLSLKLFFLMKNYILLVFKGRVAFKNILLLSSGDNFFTYLILSPVYSANFSSSQTALLTSPLLGAISLAQLFAFASICFFLSSSVSAGFTFF